MTALRLIRDLDRLFFLGQKPFPMSARIVTYAIFFDELEENSS